MLSEDGQNLTVKEINAEHNHMISNESFQHLPRQRKLDTEATKEASLLLSLKANKKMVQEHLQVVRSLICSSAKHLCVETGVSDKFSGAWPAWVYIHCMRTVFDA